MKRSVSEDDCEMSCYLYVLTLLQPESSPSTQLEGDQHSISIQEAENKINYYHRLALMMLEVVRKTKGN